MEQLDKIVIGWVAVQSLGIGGLIWRFINLFFDVKTLKLKIVELELKIKEIEVTLKAFEPSVELAKKFDKIEKSEARLELRFDDFSKNHQELRESQIKQQASLDQIKETLSMLSSQLLEKKTDSNN